jgi:hypothetical protein
VVAQNDRSLRVQRDPALLVGFNSASASRPSSFRIARRNQTDSLPSDKSRSSSRSAASSPRRAPVVIAVQINAPQSGSRHDSLTIRAASRDVGGCGFGLGAAGGSAWLIGLTATHRQRTAFL